MDNGAFFLGAFVAMFFGTVILTVYIYGMYRLGQAAGERDGLQRPLGFGLAKIGAFWAPISLWPIMADWNPFAKLGTAMVFFILHAYPMGIGFAVTYRAREQELARRFRKNVDDWLGEWEGEAAALGWDEEGGER